MKRKAESKIIFQRVTENKDFASDMSFHNPATATWLPLLQLTVCHNRLGQKELALSYHLAAKKLKPAHPSVKFNDNYFRQIGLCPLEDNIVKCVKKKRYLMFV